MVDNKECYNFKKITYTDGIFSKSIDATYVIHLEGNGRLPDVESQLNEYHTTNTVYIVFNKGFKKCKKTLEKQNSMYDIIDANVQIFKHANENKYANILILEDDFIFNYEMKDEKHIDPIEKFLIKKIDTDFMFHLGVIPYVSIPYDFYNSVVFGAGLHACVFSKSFRNRIIESQDLIKDWDEYHNEINFSKFNRYMYYKPLCYQLVTETENKQNWNISPIISNTIIKITNLDKNPEPATSYIYILSKSILFILFFIICLIAYFYFRQPTKNTSFFIYISRVYKKFLKKL